MIEPLSLSIGRALRTHRERAGMAPSRVARQGGVSASELRAIEAGRAQPSVAVLGRIAYALGVPLTELVRTARSPEANRSASNVAVRSLDLEQIGRAIAELPPVRGSKVDAMIAATVRYAMEACDGNQSAAARMLGMERKAFVRRLSRNRRR